MPVHQGHQRTKYLYTLLFKSLLNCIALLFESHATFQVFFTTQQNTRIWRLKIGLVIETWHLITETHGSIWYANCNHVLSWNLWKVCKTKQVGFSSGIHIQTGPFDNITLTDAIRYLQPGFLTTIRNWKKYDMEAMHETTFVLRLDVAVSDLQLYFHIESINQQLDLNEKVEFVSVRKSLLWLSAPSISYHPNCWTAL